MRASPSPLKSRPRLSLGNENRVPSDTPKKLISRRQSLGGRLSVLSTNKQGERADGKVDEKGSKDFRPSLSDPQLSSLYSECIKLATANKVNQQNAWSLQLIDYMDEVIMKANDFRDIEVPDDAEESAAVLEAMAYDRHISQAKDGVPRMNFQKASCTLDASVMIYSHRVDSVHKDTFKVLGAFNRGGGEGGGGGGGEDGGDNAEGEGKKKRTRHYVSTIETNLANLNVKIFDLESQTDPVFKKTSASFDQGGARGLLLNNLGNYEGCKIAFDSDIVPDGNYDLYCEDAEVAEAKKTKQRIEKEAQAASATVSVNSDLSALWHSLGDVLGVQGEEAAVKTVSGLDLCPGLQQFYDSLDSLAELEDTAPAKKAAGDDEVESESEAEGLSEQLAAELVIGSQEPFEAMDELDRAIEHEEQVFLALQSSQPPPSTPFVDSDGGGGGEDDDDVDEQQQQQHQRGEVSMASASSLFAPPTALAARGLASPGSPGAGFDMGEEDDSEEEVPDLPLVFSDQKEDLAFIDSTLLKNWAGGSHWKFHGPKGGSGGGGGGGGDARRAKAAFEIDFFDGDEVPESAFAKAGPRASNSLTKATLMKADPTKLLLPEDLSVSATSIQKLFTRPMFIGFRPKKPQLTERNGGSKRHSLDRAHGEEDHEEDLSHGVSDLHLGGDGEDEGGGAEGRRMNQDFSRLSLEGPEGGGGAEHSDSEAEDDGGVAADGGSGMMEQQDLTTYSEFDSKFDLVAEPAMVGKVDIKFAKFAKKVDVRQLKNALWNGIESKKKTKQKSFQQTMNYLSSALPTTALQNISVSYCFICLLHLCNEKNLRLVAEPEPDGSTAHEKSPNDIGYSLADFEILTEETK